MHTYDIVILTESRYLHPKQETEYVQNILLEDGLLQKAFEDLGLKVLRVDWADPDFDWESTKAAIFRTTWDYFDRFDEFKKWLDEVEQKTQLINSISQIRWNMDKWYLKDLKEKGIRVVETKYIKRGTTSELRSLIVECGWEEVILKPTIAGAARHTYRINKDSSSEFEEIFRELIANEDMMIQPFQHNIMVKGEVSFMVIGGKYTHSLLKKGKQGDFRVQDDFGGTLHPYEPTKEEIEFAEQVANACEPLPAYARVDLMWDNNNELAVSEVELIEPELWFRRNRESAQQLASWVKEKHKM
ncbi:MAG: hypothetical protein ED557_12730 [Balneola sp.]|nr:MAG: hypothetical protein ED557_12730 [Balneola sp.]